MFASSLYTVKLALKLIRITVRVSIALLYINIYWLIDGKRANTYIFIYNGKLLPLPMNARNTRGVISALPA